MLRTSLRSARVLSSRPLASVAGPQWRAAAARPVGLISRRYFADEPPAPTPTPDVATEPTCQLGPLTREESMLSEPPKKKGFFRRLRTYLLVAIFLGGSAFSGGVYYARENDAFHDIFTQYIPYGEQAVMYLEELELQKKLHARESIPKPPRDTGPKVTIAPASGASWRVADSPESTSKSSASAGVKEKEKSTPKKDETKTVSKAAKKTLEKTKEKAPAPPATKTTPEASSPTPAVSASKPEKSSKPPTGIDPLTVKDATEPVVQELVRMLNDIVLVLNADNVGRQFKSSIDKAKSHIAKAGQQIKDIKKTAEEDAAKQVKDVIDMLEKKTKDMETATEAAMVAMELRHQAEAAQELEELRASFEERLRVMTEREKKLNEERLANVLREQAIELTQQFTKDVRNQVEAERESRLGRLQKLSSSVHDLEKLTAEWNEVVDTNLQTQKLHVAVEAVRAAMEDSNHPRPFVRELVALKRIAADNDAINAAIGSINPTAYQQGISTTSQLLDRFRRVAGEVRKASLLPDGAGVASHASSWVLSHLMFKKDGLAGGDDVESVLTRTQTLLEEGNLDEAAREMNGLQGWAKTLSRDWMAEVRRVLEVKQALDVISTEARLQTLKSD